MAHFAHYVRRVVAVPNYLDPHDPHYALPVAGGDGFQRPVFHTVPGRGGAAAGIGVGDCIWLFSQLRSPWGDLPPALDGVLEVESITTTSTARHFRATKRSRWFPLADATAALSSPTLLVVANRPVPALSSTHRHVGQALRLVRRVNDPGLLQSHASRVLGLPLTFISYRLVDGTQTAFHLAASELASDRAVFWDRWSLPRRLAERREFTASAALDRTIRRAIDQSCRVIGVSSPLYAAPGSYSRRECLRAKRQGKLLLHPHEARPLALAERHRQATSAPC